VIAVVLAAGRGTRLGAIGRDTPKPLVPVAGVPVIDRLLDALGADGFADVVVVTGHRADEVERYLASRPLRFVRQDKPRGTADAVLAAREAVGNSPFLVTWVDVLVEPGTYRRVAAAATKADAAVAVNRLDDLSAGGAVTIDDGMMTGITEKPGPVAGWNLTGVLALDTAVWPYVEAVGRSVRGEYELPDAINAWIGGGARISAVAVEGAVFEIGTPEGLIAASAAYSGETRRR
jgi:NDP-sugar pyrophosphorylase family protein